MQRELWWRKDVGSSGNTHTHPHPPLTHTCTNICKNGAYLIADEEKGSHWGLRREMMSNR